MQSPGMNRESRHGDLEQSSVSDTDSRLGLVHFRNLRSPEFHLFPTHSAGKRGMDGARRLRGNQNALVRGFCQPLGPPQCAL
jgi:hypothetical protein